MKKIAVSQRISLDEKTGEMRDSLDVRWSNYLEKVGVLGIPIPSGINVFEYLKEIDPAGLLLTGGNDVSSVSNDPLSLKRDSIEEEMIRYFLVNKLPIIGICRGMQLISQTNGLKVVPVEGHVGTEHVLISYSELAGRKVKSYHNYGIQEIGPNFEIIAKTEDGSIESIRHKELPIVGLMWHPEREANYHQWDLNLFRKIFGA